jgi:integrase/recombinase XerD
MSTTNTVSPLRQRMIEHMTARKLGPHSQRSHIRSCRRFAAFLKRSPDTATAEDVRRFQLYLVESGLGISNRNRIMTGVKFLFRVTLRRHDLAAEIYHLPEPQNLPLTISPNEAERLLAKAGSLRDHVMLSLGYGCGLRVGEIVRLRAGDIDSAQMIIRIVQSKGRKDRHVMLPPELLVSLRQWWKVRPTRFDTGVPAGERWLFPGRRQGQHLTTRQLSRLFHESAAAAGITKRVSQKPTFLQLPLGLLTLLVPCGGLTQELECQGERPVIFLTCGKVFRYLDVRQDSCTIERPAGWREVPPSRQPEGAAASPERNDCLHRTLAERAGTHHGRALLVLQRARNNLSARSGAGIDKNDKGLAIDNVAGMRSEALELLAITASYGDDLSLLQKCISN